MEYADTFLRSKCNFSGYAARSLCLRVSPLLYLEMLVQCIMYTFTDCCACPKPSAPLSLSLVLVLLHSSLPLMCNYTGLDTCHDVFTEIWVECVLYGWGMEIGPAAEIAC